MTRAQAKALWLARKPAWSWTQVQDSIIVEVPKNTTAEDIIEFIKDIDKRVFAALGIPPHMMGVHHTTWRMAP